MIQSSWNPPGTFTAFVILPNNSYYQHSAGGQATRDSFYLDVGERILNDIETRTKVECGLAGVSNLLTNTLSNRMESFVLSETLKARSPSNLPDLPSNCRTSSCSIYIYCLMRKTQSTAMAQTTSSRLKATS